MRFTIIAILALWLVPLAANADTIIGCVHQKNGKLRLVADAGQCKAGKEAAVTWNSEGPQGPPGDGVCTEQRFELVGFTTATYQADQGFFGFHQACRAEFNTEFPGVRFCNSQEVIDTVEIPNPLVGQAWVNPTLIHSTDANDFLDASGIKQQIHHLNCGNANDSGGWTILGTSGLTVNSGGYFYRAPCSDVRPVACCAPVSAE